MKILYRGVFAENVLGPVLGQNFDFGGIFQGSNINFEFFNPQKAHPCMRPRRLSHRAVKSAIGWQISEISRRKKRKKETAVKHKIAVRLA